ncbi:MAG TPA: SbcC/MukB-like Walker B domain-containing protein, partial [Actinomycetota bacterium]|nr:SbcC/MukB-like Walker B domain-containing protein [Actinomycetota bacterium]
DGDDPVAEVNDRLTALDEAVQRLEDARARAEAAELERDRLEASWSALGDRRAAIAHALTHVASVLGQALLPAGAGAAELRDHAAALGEALAAAREGAGAALADAEAAGRDVTSRLRELRASLEVDPDVALEIPWGEAVEQRGVAAEAVARLERQAAQAVELERERAAAASRAATYSQLYEDLANTRFVDFLLEDKRRVLSELATQQLKEMTGRYRFDDDGAFRIVDELNADDVRSVDTLSGGETFLASLSLALGLAEAVTRHGGRLRCFFLDEGFGSLDPESFDRALDGIERIVRQDRLIGLVSHVAALADRIPDKIVLERSDEGMSRIAQGAGNLA